MRAKRLCAAGLAVLLAAMLPIMTVWAATFEDINQPAAFLKEERSGTCTLCAAAMMLRRRALIDGDANWQSITDSAIRGAAWAEGAGLRWDFTYNGMRVTYPGVHFSTNLSTKKSEMIALLAEHPEGIVIYNPSKPHAVLLTDYQAAEGVFYCADPYLGTGRIPLAKSTLQGGTQDEKLQGIQRYWSIVNKSGGLQSETPIPTPTPTPAPTAPPASPTPPAPPRPPALPDHELWQITVAEGAALHDGPEDTYTTVVNVLPGTYVDVSELITTDGVEWGKIVYEERSGWILLATARYLDGHIGPGFPPGDVNLNGTVDIHDILGIRNHIFAIQPLTGRALGAADINGDDAINVFDVIAVRNLIFGAGKLAE